MVARVTGGSVRAFFSCREWPDHGCPTGSSQLLNMVDRMAELAGSTTVPKSGTAATATAAATDNGEWESVYVRKVGALGLHAGYMEAGSISC